MKILAFLAASFLTVSAETLTNTAGKTVDAEVGAITAEKVTLKIQDKSYEIEINSLNPASQKQIREIHRPDQLLRKPLVLS